MKRKKSYDLHLHFEQGWEFENHLNDTKGDIPKALRKMGMDRMMNGYKCFDLAERIADYRSKHSKAKISADVSDHIITFEGPEEFLKELEREGILFNVDDVENMCKCCFSGIHNSKSVHENE